MSHGKSALGKFAVGLGLAGLVALVVSFGDRVPLEIDRQHGRIYLLIISFSLLTWAVVCAVGEAIIAELREQEMTRRVLRSREAK